MKKARRGSGSIYKQDGTENYTIQYYVNGQRVREKTGSPDYRAAQQKLTQRLSQIDKGEYIERPKKPATVAELYEGLRREYRINKRRSLRSLELRWKHLRFFASYAATIITKDHLDNYVVMRLKECASNALVIRELS